MLSKKAPIVLLLLRLSLSWVYLWAFIDKIFGFGFNTPPGKAWVDGISPTLGYLKFAIKGPFKDFYASLAGDPVVDLLFMAGLLFIGLTMASGIFLKLGSCAGVLINILFYTSGFIPPEHNPFIDEHTINLCLFLLIAVGADAAVLWPARWWRETSLVKKYPILG
jgi:thiosulfate dehydrogenase [quinone] large subunit